MKGTLLSLELDNHNISFRYGTRSYLSEDSIDMQKTSKSYTTSSLLRDMVSMYL